MAFRIPPKSLAPLLGAFALARADISLNEAHSAAAVGQATPAGTVLYSREDIRACYNTVISGRTAAEIHRRMPKSWTKKDFALVKDLIGECVEAVLQNEAIRQSPCPDTISAVSGEGRLNERITHIFDPLLTAEPSDSWSTIRADHKCSICQDVLAAPVILGCTHSFCGSCLHKHTSAAGQPNVTYFCPECRVQIESSGIYERALDEAIVRKVERLPPSDEIADWEGRRGEYFTKSKRGVAHTAILEDSPEESDDRFVDAEEFIRWAVFFVAAVTVGVVVNRFVLRGQTSNHVV